MVASIRASRSHVDQDPVTANEFEAGTKSPLPMSIHTSPACIRWRIENLHPRAVSMFPADGKEVRTTARAFSWRFFDRSRDGGQAEGGSHWLRNDWGMRRRHPGHFISSLRRTPKTSIKCKKPPVLLHVPSSQWLRWKEARHACSLCIDDVDRFTGSRRLRRR